MLSALSISQVQSQSTYIDSLTRAVVNGETEPAARKSLMYYHSAENNPDELKKLASQLAAEENFIIPPFQFHLAAFLIKGDSIQGLNYLEKLRKEADKNNETKKAIAVDAEAGFLYAKLKRTSDLEQILQRVEHKSDSLDYINGRVLSSLLKAELYQLKKLPSKAIIAAKEAEEFSEIARFTNKQAVKKVLARSLLAGNQPERTIAIYSNLIKKLKASNLKPQEAELNLKIAEIHNKYNAPKNAETYLLSAYGIFKSAGMKKSAARTLLQLGETWKVADPPKALEYTERAGEAFLRLNMYAEAGNTHILAGDLLLKRTLYNRALESYQLAANHFQSAKNHTLQATAQLKSAQLYKTQNNHTKAEQFYAKSLSSAQKADNTVLYIDILKKYVQFKRETGRKDQLANLEKELNTLQNSLKQSDYLTKIDELEKSLAKATEAIDKEKSRYNRDTEKLTERNKVLEESVLTNQIIYFVSLVFFSLLIIYGAYKRILLKREKAVLQTTLEELDEETDKLIKSQDAFNYKISSDLSEGTAKTLSGVKHTFSAFFDELSFETSMKQVRYKQALEYLEEAEDEVFQLAETALPKKLKDHGIITAFPGLCDNIFGNTSIKYEFDYYGISTKDRFTQITEINCFNIVKELLINILKHSSAKTIKLKVFKSGRNLKIIVEDDGKVFKPDAETEPQRGSGLAVLRSRCRLINAELTYEPRAPKGTITTLSLKTE